MTEAQKPALLFYCQHSLGMGHLMRACYLVRALARDYRVIFLNGGPLPVGIDLPEEAEFVHLPPLGMEESGELISRDAEFSVTEARKRRREQILDRLKATKPRVIVIELFPFGRKKFAFELLPLLKAAKQLAPALRPVVLCSLRDIMVGGRRDQLRHDNRAAWLINRYFDGVLFHSDANLTRLDESFQPTLPLRKPVFYTGFVVPPTAPSGTLEREFRVVVSAGGGMVGAELFHAALDAHALLWEELRLPMTVVAGPFLPEAAWAALGERAASLAGLTLLRSVPNLGALLSQSAYSVSQCGYNTAMDLLVAKTAALVVPFSEGEKDEQLSRARKMESLGLLRVLEAAHLQGRTLAQEIKSLMDFRPRSSSLNCLGAEQSRLIAVKLAAAQSAEPAVALQKRNIT